jgi:putative nucleotidyltransferase with HDIG domain
MSDLLDKPLLNNEIKVEADHVKMGMYVSALDIPWEQSRFIFKGFLIEEDKELNEIRRVCKYIIVDKDRSVNVSYEQIAPVQDKSKPVAQGDLLQQFLADEAKNGKPLSAPVKVTEVVKPVKAVEVPPKPTGTLASILHAEAVVEPQENKAAELIVPAARSRLFRSIISPLVDLISSTPKVKENFNPNKIHQSKKHLNTAVKEDMRRMQLAKDLRAQFEFSNSQISDKFTNYVSTSSLAQEVPVAKVTQNNFMDVTQTTLALDMNDSTLHESVNVAKEAVADVVDSITRNPEAMQLVNNIRRLDEHSYQHAIDVSLLMVALGREMCLFKDDLIEVGLGGMLHDVGEVKPKGVSKINAIKNITKFRVYKDDHVQNGINIAMKSNQSKIVREIIANHHEHFDGSGYPMGRKGGQIGLYGNMICIVDTYVSLINGRNCEVALPPNKALDFMYKQKGRLFHPQMLDQFIQVIGIYPVGTIVRLNTGDIGFVIKQNKTWRMKPVVMVVMNKHKEKLETPIHVDLMNQPKNKKEISIHSDLPMDAFGLVVEDYLTI